jgi:acetylornithine deacetylase/succinyl-diaminopimelate desuccinylase-like protein
MHDDLRAAVDGLESWTRSTLEDLVRIPSVSASGFEPAEVRRAAETVSSLLADAGAQDVRLLEIDGAHPAVFGEVPAPDAAPTVLLYAHYDVQPPGPQHEWDTPPFTPVERNGRLYGRGTSDDKCGVVMHLTALSAHNGRPPVGLKFFFEGEEETGSEHLTAFLQTYSDLLEADAIVIADAENWRVGQPAFTTSLRGLIDCVVEVRVLRSAVHSGMFGGALPDALTVLSRILSTLHDERGRPAVAGLVSDDVEPLDLTAEELREQAGALDGVELLGNGSLESRIWSKPAISVLGIDAPPVAGAINQLVPAARAKVSVRLAPGDDPKAAAAALTTHLRNAAPWGASITITPGASADAFRLDATGRAYDAYRRADREAWGTDAVDIGVGGSIPFVPAFAERYPNADILLTGVADPTSRTHGPNESLDLDDLHRGCLAEAIALRLLTER